MLRDLSRRSLEPPVARLRLTPLASASADSTGRANLPGSTRERELLRAWSRMAGQLLLHSDKPHLADLIAPELRNVHAPATAVRDDAPVTRPPSKKRGRAKAAARAQTPKSARTMTLPPLSAGGMWDDDFVGDSGDATLEAGDGDEALLDAAGFV